MGWRVRHFATAVLLGLTLWLAFPMAPAAANHCSTPSYEALQGFREDEHYCEKHGFLGPIGWWWNTVRYDFFDGNMALMVFFGWEIFLAPLFFISAAFLTGVSVIFGRGD